MSITKYIGTAWFIEHLRRLLLSIIRHWKILGIALVKLSFKKPRPVLLRCSLLFEDFLKRFDGHCIIYEKSILSDAKEFQVAVVYNTFLVVFIVNKKLCWKRLSQWNQLILNVQDFRVLLISYERMPAKRFVLDLESQLKGNWTRKC